MKRVFQATPTARRRLYVHVLNVGLCRVWNCIEALCGRRQEVVQEMVGACGVRRVQGQLLVTESPYQSFCLKAEALRVPISLLWGSPPLLKTLSGTRFNPLHFLCSLWLRGRTLFVPRQLPASPCNLSQEHEAARFQYAAWSFGPRMARWAPCNATWTSSLKHPFSKRSCQKTAAFQLHVHLAVFACKQDAVTNILQHIESGVIPSKEGSAMITRRACSFVEGALFVGALKEAKSKTNQVERSPGKKIHPNQKRA